MQPVQGLVRQSINQPGILVSNLVCQTLTLRLMTFLGPELRTDQQSDSSYVMQNTMYQISPPTAPSQKGHLVPNVACETPPGAWAIAWRSPLGGQKAARIGSPKTALCRTPCIGHRLGKHENSMGILCHMWLVRQSSVARESLAESP